MMLIKIKKQTGKNVMFRYFGRYTLTKTIGGIKDKKKLHETKKRLHETL